MSFWNKLFDKLPGADTVDRAQTGKLPGTATVDGDQTDLLRQAVVKGDIDQVKTLTGNNSALIWSKNVRGWTALHCAVSGGHKEIVELLLAKGAEVNAKNDNGMTALHCAASDGHKEIVEQLLAKKAEVNAKGGLVAETALHFKP